MKTLTNVLTEAHKILLQTYVHGEGCRPGENCILQCIALANGQPAGYWQVLRGLGAEAEELLDDLVTGEQMADHPNEGHRGLGYGCLTLTEMNDNTNLEVMSNFMVDAIAIARAEE